MTMSQFGLRPKLDKVWEYISQMCYVISFQMFFYFGHKNEHEFIDEEEIYKSRKNGNS